MSIFNSGVDGLSLVGRHQQKRRDLFAACATEKFGGWNGQRNFSAPLGFSLTVNNAAPQPNRTFVASVVVYSYPLYHSIKKSLHYNNGLVIQAEMFD